VSGASADWFAGLPQSEAPRRAAVSITPFGPSTWQVMTSQPASASGLVAAAALTAGDHSRGKMTWQVIVGQTARAPGKNNAMLSRTCGIGFAATTPIR
jgi:hypothetical protein